MGIVQWNGVGTQWRAKRFGNELIELRRHDGRKYGGGVLLRVWIDGSIRISSTGTTNFTAQEFMEMAQAVQEAQADFKKR